MIRQTLLLSLAVTSLLAASGCSGADTADSADSDDALGTQTVNLKDYALTAGIIATGTEARSLLEDMKKSGAKEGPDGVLIAGLTGEELGLTDPDDKDESFGIECTPKESDHTFHQDTCSLNAIVKSAGQEKRGEASYVITLSGKLAKAVANSLPRTSPEGLVGSTTTASGRISCKSIPGPAGATCTVPIAGVLETLDEAVHDTSSDSPMTAADARKIVKAFF
jgi:hypothetical protein